MRDQERLTRPLVMSPPAEIDTANAEHVDEQLCAAFAPDVIAIIAEIGLTVFCSTSGGCQLVAVHERATGLLRDRVSDPPEVNCYDRSSAPDGRGTGGSGCAARFDGLL
jgi:hypothetical protein